VREMPDDPNVLSNVRDVDGGPYYSKRARPGALAARRSKKRVGNRDMVEHTVPTLAEFFKAEWQKSKFFRRMFVPIPAASSGFLQS